MPPSNRNRLDERPGTAERFQLGDWLVSPGSGEITRDNTRVRIEPKAMDVLVYLAAHEGEVVSREDLERHVWRGALVGYDAVTGTVIKLRRALDDDARQPRYITTVPKRGYRLLPGLVEGCTSAITAHTPSMPPLARRSSGEEPTTAETRGVRSWRRAASVSALVLALLMAAVVVLVADRRLATNIAERVPELKSIAVLPFRNLSDDRRQDYFAEGMGDDLITSLARFSDLQVIDRESTSLYSETPLEARTIADRLNARYLVRGSVQRMTNQVRITVRLIDTQSGDTLWADSFDDDARRLFEMPELCSSCT
jgi:TolB-like protein/DNA-binding winged helix-turn-helix (wHTH) protein